MENKHKKEFDFYLPEIPQDFYSSNDFDELGKRIEFDYDGPAPIELFRSISENLHSVEKQFKVESAERKAADEENKKYTQKVDRRTLILTLISIAGMIISIVISLFK